MKSMFLLSKRVYSVFSCLNQMLLFDSNEAGLIEIEQSDWIEFVTSEYFQQELGKMRTII